jgi:hypothetical protein
MDEREVDSAWAEVAARWADEGVHRAFLDRLGDLDALAKAGRRYRARLDERPGDEVAARWRDEVLKRATALAFAQLPRTKPPRRLPAGLRRALILGIVAANLVAAAWVVLGMPRVLP